MEYRNRARDRRKGERIRTKSGSGAVMKSSTTGPSISGLAPRPGVGTVVLVRPEARALFDGSERADPKGEERE